MSGGMPANDAALVFWETCQSQKNKYYALDTGDGDGSFYIQSTQDLSYCVHAAVAPLLFWAFSFTTLSVAKRMKKGEERENELLPLFAWERCKGTETLV